jgi:hypothetical protein
MTDFLSALAKNFYKSPTRGPRSKKVSYVADDPNQSFHQLDMRQSQKFESPMARVSPNVIRASLMKMDRNNHDRGRSPYSITLSKEDADKYMG